MKRTIVAVVLLLSAVSLTLWSGHVFRTELNSLTASLNEIIDCSENCSDETLNQKINKLLFQWQHSSVLLHSLVLHEGMDEIEQNITSLPLLAEHSSRDELRNKCIEAINQIKNLSEAEKLSIENIF